MRSLLVKMENGNPNSLKTLEKFNAGMKALGLNLKRTETGYEYEYDEKDISLMSKIEDLAKEASILLEWNL